MKTLSFLKIAAVAALMLVGVSVAAPAQAGTGNWNDTANGPTMYQTNLWYNSGSMNPLVTPPAGATISSISWVLNLSYYPYGLWVYLVSEGTQQYREIQTVTGSGSFGTGVTANQGFHYMFGVATSTTQTLSPPIYGGGHQLNVNYAY